MVFTVITILNFFPLTSAEIDLMKYDSVFQ